MTNYHARVMNIHIADQCENGLYRLGHKEARHAAAEIAAEADAELAKAHTAIGHLIWLIEVEHQIDGMHITADAKKLIYET